MAVDPTTWEGKGDPDRGNHMLKVSETPLNLDRKEAAWSGRGREGSVRKGQEVPLHEGRAGVGGLDSGGKRRDGGVGNGTWLQRKLCLERSVAADRWRFWS